MAFPTTGMVGDPWTDATWDTHSNWSVDPMNGGRTRDPIAYSGVGIGTNATDHAFDQWLQGAGTFGPDTECFVSFPTVGAGFLIRLYARLVQPSSAFPTGDAYIVQGAPGASSQIYRVVNAVGTALGTAFTMNAGATKLGLEVTGTGATVTINVYEYVSGSWSLAKTHGDTDGARLTAAGYIGVLFADTAGASRLTDFGGGTVLPSQTISVGTATETDTAEAIVGVFDQTISVGTASETDTGGVATVVTVSGTRAQGGLAWLFRSGSAPTSQTITVGTATETDTAFAVTIPPDQTISVGTATETDTAVAVSIAVAQTISVGTAVETDTAGTVTQTVPGTVVIHPQGMVPGTVIGAYLRWEWKGPVAAKLNAGPGAVVEETTVSDELTATFTLDRGEYVAYAEDYPTRRLFFMVTETD